MIIKFSLAKMKNKRKPNNERKGLPVLLHVIGWIILFILPQFLLTGGTFPNIRTIEIIIFNTFVFGVIFYLNYLWLVPRFLLRKRGLIYFPAVIVLLIFMQTGNNKAFISFFPPPDADRTEMQKEYHSENRQRRKFPRRMAVYNFYINAVLVSSFAVGLRYAERSRIREREMKELEKEKLNSELAMLKNQISPHFFFNTLNNIYSLIEINKADAQTSVLNLSKMMRYLLYESEHGNARLSREIQFMTNYIDLMKLRLSSRVNLRVDFPQKYDDMDVPPLLFITFIENAFKHSASFKGSPFIEISLAVEGSVITFMTRNSINNPSSAGAPEVDSGIGLENVKKRLSLIFDNNYDLDISNKDSVYSVTLKIDTSKAIPV